jgi:hypothetical protein
LTQWRLLLLLLALLALLCLRGLALLDLLAPGHHLHLLAELRRRHVVDRVQLELVVVDLWLLSLVGVVVADCAPSSFIGSLTFWSRSSISTLNLVTGAAPRRAMAPPAQVAVVVVVGFRLLLTARPVTRGNPPTVTPHRGAMNTFASQSRK